MLRIMDGYSKILQSSYIDCLVNEDEPIFHHAILANSDDKYMNEKYSIELLMFAIEQVLCWTPAQAMERLTTEIIKKLKLEFIVSQYTNCPKGVLFDDDYSYLVHKMYPKQTVYNFESSVIKSYSNVINGKVKGFNKKFFVGVEGKKRALVCMRYIVNNYCVGFTIEELYRFFSTADGSNFIKNNKLKLPRKLLFNSNVEFLHYSLPSESRNDWFYHYYQAAELYWNKK